MNQKPLSKIQTVKAKYVAPIIKNISKTLGNDLEKNRQKKILQIMWNTVLYGTRNSSEY